MHEYVIIQVIIITHNTYIHVQQINVLINFIDDNFVVEKILKAMSNFLRHDKQVYGYMYIYNIIYGETYIDMLIQYYTSMLSSWEMACPSGLLLQSITLKHFHIYNN